MANPRNWIEQKLLQNVLSWTLAWLLCAMVINAENRLWSALQLTGFLVLPVYINNLAILPLFGRTRKLLASLLFVLNALLFAGIAVFYLSDYFEIFEWRMLFNLFGMMLIVLLTGSALKMARDSIVRRQQVREAELQLLKAQLNPHFLFNTLNNLYGLAVLKSEKLPDLMLQLSDLLRYSLYDTKAPFVDLAKEVQYLENYVALERIRLEADTAIDFEVSGRPGALRIAPMLLIVFVENAFKHLGINAAQEQYVRIELEMKDTELNFRCHNSRAAGQEINHKLEAGKSGIGLQNVRKRLDFIYPGQYQLQVEEKSGEYLIQLNLQCS